MNVLLLGAGSMGRWAGQTAAAFPRISQLSIADRNLPAAQALAAQCGPKAEAMGLDVEDTDALRAALHGHQAVLNCVGPYYRFGLPILQAAIGAGCHYLDLCDDWEPTLDMLRLHDAARAAGVTAVVGLGASPGVSNLLAVQLARSFDQVTQLHTGWRVESAWAPDPDGKEDGSQAAIEHWVHGFTAPIAVQENGSRQIKAPLEPVTLLYPGVGARTFYTLGHPEAVTLPRTIPGLQASKNLMHLHPSTLEAITQLAGAVQGGQLSVAGAAAAIAQAQQAKPAGEAPIPAGEGEIPSLFAWAEGWSQGRWVQRAIGLRAYPPGGMGSMTGIPLAVGLALLLEEKLTKKGVLTPEEAFDPDAFFGLFAPYCTYPAPVTEGRLIHLLAM
jgi:saccharopine dehydrogenase-like NADP-dependent oxidoreductase